MGMEDAFTYEPGADDYFETADYEERAPHMQFIDTYDEDVFWLMLTSKLEHRDLAAEEVLRADPPVIEDERVTQLFDRIARNEDAFAEHGLDSIQFVLDMPWMH
jgi:hypothetical protein